MRQLITRVPDDLHEQLKRHAQARGQSVNELVVGVLSAAVGQAPTRSSVRELLAARGLLVVPPASARSTSASKVPARSTGRGPTLADLVEAERAATR